MNVYVHGSGSKSGLNHHFVLDLKHTFALIVDYNLALPSRVLRTRFSLASGCKHVCKFCYDYVFMFDVSIYIMYK